MLWMVLHVVDDHGYQFPKKIRAITDLSAIDFAIPGRTAVDELVSKNIKPSRDDRQDLQHLVACEGEFCGPSGFSKSRLPFNGGQLSIVMAPEVRENVLVGQQQPNASRELCR